MQLTKSSCADHVFVDCNDDSDWALCTLFSPQKKKTHTPAPHGSSWPVTTSPGFFYVGGFFKLFFSASHKCHCHHHYHHVIPQTDSVIIIVSSLSSRSSNRNEHPPTLSLMEGWRLFCIQFFHQWQCISKQSLRVAHHIQGTWRSWDRAVAGGLQTVVNISPEYRQILSKSEKDKAYTNIHLSHKKHQ